MNRLPPHKRTFTTLYRAWFWTLKGLEAKPDKTPEDRLAIVDCLYHLDKMWNAMPIDQKRDLDPMWELHTDIDGVGEPWWEMKVLKCPNCGYLHYVSIHGDAPPRCYACMCDVAYNTRPGESMFDRATEDLQRQEDEKLLEEMESSLSERTKRE